MNYDLDTLIYVLNRSIQTDTFSGMYKRARKNSQILDLILYYQKITGEKWTTNAEQLTNTENPMISISDEAVSGETHSAIDKEPKPSM